MKDKEMKYDAFIFNPGNEHPIGQAYGNSISELRHHAIRNAIGYNGKGGRIMVQDQKTGKVWRFNS